MTTSTSNARADALTPVADPALTTAGDGRAALPPPRDAQPAAARELPHTVWSRFIILMICLAVVTTTLAFGTVHAWSLAAFQLSAAIVFALWMADAWRTGVLRVSRNVLQLPLLGLAAVGLIQLLPLGSAPLTYDPQATRVALVEIAGLVVYFAAALAFVDSPRRLRLLARLVIVFGFLLAVYGLMQHFVNPRTIFWVREPKQAEPFGPYVNRHHFAGYMELALAMPLGLLFAGAVGRERVVLYGFATAIMAIALVMTNSRGGLVSMVCEILFLAAVSMLARGRRREGEGREGSSRLRAAAVRVGLGFALVLAVFVGVLYFGGEDALSRVAGTVYSEDPTTGRAHFWRGALGIIGDHPVTGTGLGSFGSVYPRYDTGNGAYRLEQAHNDYLQILSDAGVVGGALGLFFVAALFWMALKRMHSHDRFRRGVALGALGGCVGALVHSFFDFTLHTTANALLFLLLAALATVNGRVEEADAGGHGRKRRRRRRQHHRGADSQEEAPPAHDAAGGGEGAGAHA
ncbi:MAG TPA: O-antigen ligase family protein [Pyrinomonadaceae bacterium]|jgi:O-antigen ligase